ncbi:conserved hypothetical protein [Burkholderiales bacterium 8X]|nr:conserved hypothetical protein [Burkholderiales bacterium 8X]
MNEQSAAVLAAGRRRPIGQPTKTKTKTKTRSLGSSAGGGLPRCVATLREAARCTALAIGALAMVQLGGCGGSDGGSGAGTLGGGDPQVAIAPNPDTAAPAASGASAADPGTATGSSLPPNSDASSASPPASPATAGAAPPLPLSPTDAVAGTPALPPDKGTIKPEDAGVKPPTVDAASAVPPPPAAPVPAPPSSADLARKAVLDAYRGTLLPALAVSPAWTGNLERCAAGDTSPGYKAAVLAGVNYYRSLAGLGPVKLNASYSARAQQAALMMGAERRLSHHPDASWKCYTRVGAEAADASNLAYGFRGALALPAYMDDASAPELGHRRWLLYPWLKEIGTGDTAGTNALYVYGDAFADLLPARAAEDGIAWPPRGFVPLGDHTARPTWAWSFDLPDGDLRQATVTLTNDRGQVMPIATRLTGDEHPALVWRLQAPESAWSRSPADTRFTVRIDNARTGSRVRSISYDVIFALP